MNAQKRLNPFPGFVILEPHELKRKIGGYEMPQTEEENTPQIGKVIMVGKKAYHSSGRDYIESPAKVGDIVAYKKYQDFPIQIGTQKYIAVAFENLLFEIKEVK